MKKIILTILVSISVIFGIMLADYIINNSFKSVDTKTVSKTSKENYIELKGVVKEINKREIKLNYPLTIKKLYVSVGDKVNQGQKLADINKNNFIKKMYLAQANSSSPSSFDNIILDILNHDDYIYSPINGIVSNIYVNEGSDCSIEFPVIEITDTENVIIKSRIKSGSLTEIHLNQSVYIITDEITLKGSISKIYPIAYENEDKSSYVNFDIVPEKSANLICGSSVNIKIIKELFDNILVVPYDSVVYDNNIPYVYVDESGYAVKRRVVLGNEFDTSVEIKSGLSEKDRIILEPLKYNLNNGDKLSDGE